MVERRATRAGFDTCLRPYQWFCEAVEKGHLFSGSCGEQKYFLGFREQGAGG